jgi:hypothetical protein
MKYEWENGQGVFIKDKKRILGPYRWTQDGWYLKSWTLREGKKEGARDFFEVNFEKIFTGKKPGDVFLFTITLVYSLDGDPENTQVMEYKVETRKGKYVYQSF